MSSWGLQITETHSSSAYFVFTSVFQCSLSFTFPLWQFAKIAKKHIDCYFPKEPDYVYLVIGKNNASMFSQHQPSLQWKTTQLTEAGVDEAVPAAADAPQQPPPPNAGRETESGSEQTHQHVADADVQQQHVHRRAQFLEFAEQQQHNKVVEEAEGHYEAQDHGQHDEARRGQLPSAGRRVPQLPVIAQVKAGIESRLTRKHAALHSSEPGSTLRLCHLGSVTCLTCGVDQKWDTRCCSSGMEELPHTRCHINRT